jgi:hypothetical protein
MRDCVAADDVFLKNELETSWNLWLDQVNEFSSIDDRATRLHFEPRIDAHMRYAIARLPALKCHSP